MEPNKERIEKWVAALESDEMQGRQTFNVLNRPDGTMCAAGVGVYVCETAHWGDRIGSSLAAGWYGLKETTVKAQGDFYAISSYSQSPEIRPALEALPLEVDGQTGPLYWVNDNLKLSFREIAQLIRKQYL